ncbi:MAG TPA: translocation/assembly module TamB domain-containing protein [Stellaceae bacterium]|nr:translocation/assembly module TamB domain-containing protein [Stellaceae bacterium]
MGTLGRIGKILAGIVLGIVLLVGIAFAVAQTRPAKAWLAAQLAASLSGDGRSAEIGRIEGTVPFDMQLDALHLADADGEFLTVRNLAFAMAPGALLHRRVEITRLSVDEIALTRPPTAKPASTPAQPMKLLDMLHLPVAVALDDLKIGAIRVGAPVLGEPVDFAVSGISSLAGGDASARVAIRRIDGEAGQADLSLALSGEPARLQLALDIAEPSGVLLDRLLARDDRQPLALSLKGDGPLADWRGVLAASAGDLARIDADLTIAEAEEYRLGAEGRVAAAKLLPPDLAALLGDQATFALQLRDSAAGVLSIDKLSLVAAAATLNSSLQYGGNDRALVGTATLTTADLAPFSAVAGMSLSGAGELRLTASGTPQRPQADIAIEATAPHAEGNGADRARAQLHLASQGDPADLATRWTVSGEGSIENIVAAAGDIPAGLGATLTWHLAGSADGSGETIEISDLGVATAGIELAGTATIRDHFATIAGKASLTVADIAPFAALAGQKMGGNGKIDLVAEAAADGSTNAHLTGTLAGLTLGGLTVGGTGDALLGGSLAIDGTARRSADGGIVVEKFDLNATDAMLSAKGDLTADRRINATLKLDVPKLAALAAPLGTAMAGRLALQATAQGPLDAPAIAATVDGDGLSAGQARLDRLHANFRVADLAVPSGRLDASFRAGSLEGTLGADIARRQDGNLLDIGKLRLAADGSTLEGGLRIALDSGRATGTITGRVVDLAPWSQLAGMTLAGRADLKATLGGKTGQGLELSLNGNAIKATPRSGSPIAVTRLTVAARLDDLLGTPSGHASLDLAGGQMGTVKLATLSAKLGSVKPGRFAFTGEARGSIHEKFALATGGDVDVARGGVTLRLARLTGDVAGEALRLTQTLTVTRRGADLAVTNLALTLGAGQLAGSASLKGEQLALTLKAQRLPVGFAGKFAGRADAGGTLSFDADLAGTRSKPQGHLVVDARDLRLAAANRSDLPPLGITADALWRGGRVEAKGRIAGPRNDAIGFAGSLPLELVPATLAVRLPPDGAVTLKLEGEGQIADIEELLPLGEDRLAGKFSLDASVAGTVTQPRASGALRISDGRYESMAAGTILTGVAFDLVGDRERFVLRNFRAGDGERGTMTASGSVDLAATPGPTIAASIDVKSFRVLRRDEANVLAGGEIRISGALTALRIASQLRVEHGELRPPDRLPPSVASLDIVEINSVTGQRAPPPAQLPPQEQSDPMLPAVLDITIDLPGQVFVRGRGLDSEWRGKLAVTGTSAEPIVTGSLEVVRGTFSLLGKDFKLSSGTIGFNGDTKIDPTIAIVAEATTADITATVTIGGIASAPTLKLGSVPEMPQDEVLARVLFGKNVGQITPAQGLQIAAAAASLAGGGGGLLDKVRSALGLDRFDFGSGTTANNAAGNASSNPASQGLGAATISAGKYIAEGVYVGVDQGASTGTSRGKVEIEIAPNISVETDVGMTGGNGLGLNWKRDY